MVRLVEFDRRRRPRGHLGGLAASNATASAVNAPARNAASSPAMTWSWGMFWCSRRTSIMARVPSRSPWALRTVAHQASWLLVNFPVWRACSKAVAPRHRAGLADQCFEVVVQLDTGPSLADQPLRRAISLRLS